MSCWMTIDSLIWGHRSWLEEGLLRHLVPLRLNWRRSTHGLGVVLVDSERSLRPNWRLSYSTLSWPNWIGHHDRMEHSLTWGCAAQVGKVVEAKLKILQLRSIVPNWRGRHGWNEKVVRVELKTLWLSLLMIKFEWSSQLNWRLWLDFVVGELERSLRSNYELYNLGAILS